MSQPETPNPIVIYRRDNALLRVVAVSMGLIAIVVVCAALFMAFNVAKSDGRQRSQARCVEMNRTAGTDINCATL